MAYIQLGPLCPLEFQLNLIDQDKFNNGKISKKYIR